MPWIYNDAEINGIVDSSLKDAPPAAPMSNTAGSVRALLKNMWVAMRGQVASAVASIDAVNASLVARSLNLNATIFVDATNGDDARTGETNNSNALTGRVKTLQRAIQLHSQKTYNLNLNIVAGEVIVDANLTLTCPFVSIVIHNGATLKFNKQTIAGVGEGNFNLSIQGITLSVGVNTGGKLISEQHAGYIGGSLATYNAGQGCIRLTGSILSILGITLYSTANNTIDVGNNSTMFCLGAGIDPINRVPNGRFLFTGGYYTHIIGSNSQLSATAYGDKAFVRQYHPTSSTDSAVIEGETVISPINNKLWTKRSGTIRDAMGTTFV
jgi:hypothetical protein